MGRQFADRTPIGMGRWIVPGGWIGPMGKPSASTVGLSSSSSLYLIPIPIQVGGSIDRIAIVQSGAGSAGDTAELAAFRASYEDPFALTELASGAIDIETTGTKEVTVDVYVPVGVLWLGIRNTGPGSTATFERTDGNGFHPVLGNSATDEGRAGWYGAIDWPSSVESSNLSGSAAYVRVRGA